MSELVLSALISGGFALIGTIIGIIGSSKITVYRIEQLEKKVDGLGNVLERTTRLEEQVDHVRDDISDIKKMITK